MDGGVQCMRSMARVTHGMAVAAMLAASLLLAAVPANSAADPHRIVFPGHVAARGPVARGPVMRGGMQMRGGMHLAEGPRRFDGPRDQGRFAGGPHEEGHWHGPGDGGGGWHGPGDGGRWHGPGDERRWHGGDEEHFWHDGPRYAVPPHWNGMHPDWDDGRPPGYWVRPWGPRWEPGYWGGGYWDGRFWPHVYLDWDFPWFLGALPAGCVTYWWGNVPYYYWQGVYYLWSPDYGAYVVADPPPITGGAVQGAAPPPSAQTPGSNSQGALSLYVYPKRGQSKQQTQNDRYQCHEWAVGQTGFDPTNPVNDTHAATATPSNYKRAVTACLEARGYSVR